MVLKGCQRRICVTFIWGVLRSNIPQLKKYRPLGRIFIVHIHIYIYKDMYMYTGLRRYRHINMYLHACMHACIHALTCHNSFVHGSGIRVWSVLGWGLEPGSLGFWVLG